jgi:hypothetical protein
VGQLHRCLQYDYTKTHGCMLHRSRECGHMLAGQSASVSPFLSVQETLHSPALHSCVISLVFVVRKQFRRHAAAGRCWVHITLFQQPCTDRAQQDVCLFCFKCGPVSAVMTIPRRGYVSGEHILISAEINNLHNKPISYVKATLVQVIKKHNSMM